MNVQSWYRRWASLSTKVKVAVIAVLVAIGLLTFGCSGGSSSAHSKSYEIGYQEGRGMHSSGNSGLPPGGDKDMASIQCEGVFNADSILHHGLNKSDFTQGCLDGVGAK
jgi:hypothetical protein